MNAPTTTESTTTTTRRCAFAAVEVFDPVLGWKPIYVLRDGDVRDGDAWPAAMAYALSVSDRKEEFSLSSDREIRITGDGKLPLSLSCRKHLPAMMAAMPRQPVRRTFERGWPSL